MDLKSVTIVHSLRVKISILLLCNSEFWMPNSKDFGISNVLGICIPMQLVGSISVQHL